MAGDADLLAGNDGLDRLRERPPGFLGGLPVIVFVPAAPDVAEVMVSAGAVVVHMAHGVIRRQRNIPARGIRGADSGGNLLGGKGGWCVFHNGISLEFMIIQHCRTNPRQKQFL